MTIAVVRTNVLPNDDRDDINFDIDRWENDGGRNSNIRGNNIKDHLD